MLRDWKRILPCFAILFGGCSGGETPVDPLPPEVVPQGKTPQTTTNADQMFTLTVDGENTRFGEAMLFAEVSSANQGREFIASAPGLNQIFVYSAETGALVQTLGGGALQELGARAVEIGDVNSDGHTDLLLTHQQGLVLALSGPSGLTLETPYTFVEGEQLGKIVALALVQPTTAGGPFQVVAIRDRIALAEPGSELSIFNVTAQGVTKQSSVLINTDGSGVYRLDSGEWTGEGQPEIALAMPFAENEKGAIRVYSLTRQASGVGLTELTAFTGSTEGDRLGYAMVFGRVSNDDVDDLIFSAPWANKGIGAVWTMYGGAQVPQPATVDALPTHSTGTAEVPLIGLVLSAPKSDAKPPGTINTMSRMSTGITKTATIRFVPCEGCTQTQFNACNCYATTQTECKKTCCCIKIEVIEPGTMTGPTGSDDTKIKIGGSEIIGTIDHLSSPTVGAFLDLLDRTKNKITLHH